MPTPWDAPADADPAEAPPAPPAAGSPDGELDPMRVPSLVWEDLKQNPGGHFLAGVGLVLGMLAPILASVGALVVCVAPGLILEDDTIGAVGMLVGFSLYVLGIFATSFVAYPLLTASLLRTLDDRRSGGAALGLGSPFARIRERAGAVVGFYALSQGLVLVGIFLCYLPGLVASAVSLFALPILVFEEVGPVEALRRGWAHMAAQPVWHLGIWLLLFAALILLELTVVGLLLMLPVVVLWQYHAYREAFAR